MSLRKSNNKVAGKKGELGVDEEIHFAQWYEAAYPKLLATMLLVIGDIDEAKEVVDEACLRALVHWSRIGASERPEGWTYRVAYNVFRRRARRRNIERYLLSREPNPTNVPEPAGELWLLVNDLPRRQREVVTLRYVGDLTENEIATTLGIARGTVSRTLGTARKKLADWLAEPTPPLDKDTPCVKQESQQNTSFTQGRQRLRP